MMFSHRFWPRHRAKNPNNGALPCPITGLLSISTKGEALGSRCFAVRALLRAFDARSPFASCSARYFSITANQCCGQLQPQAIDCTAGANAGGMAVACQWHGDVA